MVSALTIGLGTIAVSDYMRPSKREARQLAIQEEVRAEQERVNGNESRERWKGAGVLKRL